MNRRVAVHCSVLQCIAVCLQCIVCVAVHRMCCSVLQYIMRAAVCSSAWCVLKCVAVCCSAS